MFKAGTAANGALEGDVVLYAGTTPFCVTRDVSDSSITRPAGVAVTTMANSYYGWIQVGGFCGTLITDGNITAGALLAATSTDGVAGSLTVGTDTSKAFGVALNSDSGTVLADAMLTIA